MNVKIFNFFEQENKKNTVILPKELLNFVFRPVLIDDVDTTITSFLKTYGAPPHIDAEDFEYGDDKDFDEFDDGDDFEPAPAEPAPAEPAPAEPAPAEPAPAEPAPAEPVSE